MAASTKSKTGKTKTAKTKKAGEPVAASETFKLDGADVHEKCLVCGLERAGDVVCRDCGYEYGGPPPVIEVINIDPALVRDGENSRVEEAVDYAEKVKARAIDLFINGQINPGEVRLTGEVEGVKTYETISGYTRRDAVRLLREGFTAPHPHSGETFLFRDPDRLFRASVVKVNAEQAFIRSIRENAGRDDTTDLQEALAHDKLRRDWAWTDTRIAGLYGYTNQNRVMALKNLLKLDKKTQMLVHGGKLSLSAALLTKDVTDEERESIIAGASDGDKVRGAAVASLVRELLDRKAGIDPDAPVPDAGLSAEPERVSAKKDEDDKRPKVPKRGRADVQRFVLDVSGEESESKLPLKDETVNFLTVLHKFLNGTRNETSLKNALIALDAKVKG